MCITIKKQARNKISPDTVEVIKYTHEYIQLVLATYQTVVGASLVALWASMDGAVRRLSPYPSAPCSTGRSRASSRGWWHFPSHSISSSTLPSHRFSLDSKTIYSPQSTYCLSSALSCGHFTRSGTFHLSCAGSSTPTFPTSSGEHSPPVCN